jgi:hypothetical protein
MTQKGRSELVLFRVPQEAHEDSTEEEQYSKDPAVDCHSGGNFVNKVYDCH